MVGSLGVVDLDLYQIRPARRLFKVPGGRRGQRPARSPAWSLAEPPLRD
jgi:hypothetical protein